MDRGKVRNVRFVIILVPLVLLLLGLYNFLPPLTTVFGSNNLLLPLSSCQIPHVPSIKTDTQFLEWIDKQSTVALDKILRNIVASGVVVASPSKKDPDYFYQWTRDGAIVMNTLIDTYFDLQLEGNREKQEEASLLLGHILDYFNTSFTLQRLGNPSGNFSFGDKYRSLGEPKFNVDNTVFQSEWGRPQNDGSPLRLSTAISFLTRMNQTDIVGSNPKVNYFVEKIHINRTLSSPYALANGYELIENVLYFDMKFLSLNWNESYFDLWEEVYGKHFFTTLVQYNAAVMSIGLLESLRDTYGYYPGGDHELLGQLRYTRDNLGSQLVAKDNFLQEDKPYIVETPERDMKQRPTGLDVAILLGVNTIYRNGVREQIPPPLRINSPKVLATFHELVKRMSTIYPINNGKLWPRGVALGRYPEDIYDGRGFTGGNPWFLCTLAASEFLLRLITEYQRTRSDILIGMESRDFWSSVLKGLKTNPHNKEGVEFIVVPFNSATFNQTVRELFDLSESFLDVVRQHVSREGYEMSEQFDKRTGFLTGARDLTWSYSSFLDTVKLRTKVWQLMR